MELTNEFTVDAPVDQAWAVLTDLERIAPCMPGAQLTEVEGDEYRGTIKVKVGPISAQYKGAASFVSRDDASHVAVLKAEGRDTRGQGNASATITATLAPAGAGTKVVVATDLTITGKVAQMGRGVLADVSAKLLDQFADSLERDVLTSSDGESSAPATGNGAEAPGPPTPGGVGGSATPGGVGGSATPGGVGGSATPGGVGGSSTMDAVADVPPIRKIDSPEAKPVDLLDTAGAPVAKRIGPIIGILVVVLWLMRRRRKRRR